MRIVVAGIKRSGSTVQYNLIRIAMQQGGYQVRGFGQSYNTITPVREGECHLVKIHPYREAVAEAADYIFTTDRRDKDVLASLDRMWDSGNPDRINSMRANLTKWKQHTTYDFHYEALERNIYTWAWRIVGLLPIRGVDAREVVEEFEAIELPKAKQDPVTLFFPGHITSE